MNNRKVNTKTMRNHAPAALFLALAAAVCAPMAQAAVLPADVVTVGNVIATSAIVDVPVYIRDTSGTPVGVDQPPGSKLQAYSIKVDYAPAASIASAGMARAGITASLTPLSEFAPVSPGSTSLIDDFYEPTNPVPFTSNAVLPGNQVAHILVQLSPSVTPGSVITLTLDPILTTVSNDGGTTTETVANGNLALVSGSITIPPTFVFEIPTLSHWMLALLAMALAVVAVKIRM
jgi:hypothetical protein